MKRTIFSCLIVVGVCIFCIIIVSIINLITAEKPQDNNLGHKVYAYECPYCGYNGTYSGIKEHARCNKCKEYLWKASYKIGYYHISTTKHCDLYKYTEDSKWYRFNNYEYYDSSTKTLKENAELKGWNEYYGTLSNIDNIDDRYLGMEVNVLEFFNDDTHYPEYENKN